jgi:hypothetical protein
MPQHATNDRSDLIAWKPPTVDRWRKSSFVIRTIKIRKGHTSTTWLHIWVIHQGRYVMCSCHFEMTTATVCVTITTALQKSDVRRIYSQFALASSRYLLLLACVSESIIDTQTCLLFLLFSTSILSFAAVYFRRKFDGIEHQLQHRLLEAHHCSRAYSELIIKLGKITMVSFACCL